MSCLLRSAGWQSVRSDADWLLPGVILRLCAEKDVARNVQCIHTQSRRNYMCIFNIIVVIQYLMSHCRPLTPNSKIYIK